MTIKTHARMGVGTEGSWGEVHLIRNCDDLKEAQASVRDDGERGPHTIVFPCFLDSAEETCKDFPWSWDGRGWPVSLMSPRGATEREGKC